MVYSEELAHRIRELLGGRSGVTEKKMFGGVGWMIGGNMAVGAMSSGDLMVRLDREESEAAAQAPGARPMEHGGRLMRGFVIVDAGSVDDDGALARWVDAGADYASSLAPK